MTPITQEEFIKAGAPRLPKGCRYRIDTYWQDGTLDVRVMQSRWWWWDRTVQECAGRPATTSRDDLLRCAVGTADTLLREREKAERFGWLGGMR